MTTPRPLAADEIRPGQRIKLAYRDGYTYTGTVQRTDDERFTIRTTSGGYTFRRSFNHGRTLTLLEDAPTEDPVQKGLDYMRRYHRNLATPAPESWGNGGPLDAPTEDSRPCRYDHSLMATPCGCSGDKERRPEPVVKAEALREEAKHWEGVGSVYRFTVRDSLLRQADELDPPVPVRPPEPKGLGAVVRSIGDYPDAKPKLFVREQDGDWISPGMALFKWDELRDPVVLSEGWEGEDKQ